LNETLDLLDGLSAVANAMNAIRDATTVKYVT
jgi:hypothetical protein